MTTNYLLTVKAVESCDVPIKITVCSSSDKEKIEKIRDILNEYSKEKDIVNGDYRFSSLLFDMREREILLVRLMQVLSGTEPYDFVNLICETVKYFDIFVHDNIWEVRESVDV